LISIRYTLSVDVLVNKSSMIRTSVKHNSLISVNKRYFSSIYLIVTIRMISVNLVILLSLFIILMIISYH